MWIARKVKKQVVILFSGVILKEKLSFLWQGHTNLLDYFLLYKAHKCKFQEFEFLLFSLSQISHYLKPYFKIFKEYF